MLLETRLSIFHLAFTSNFFKIYNALSEKPTVAKLIVHGPIFNREIGRNNKACFLGTVLFLFKIILKHFPIRVY